MSKWTKEQLEKAKYYLANGCNHVACCMDCLFYGYEPSINSLACTIRAEIGFAPFISNISSSVLKANFKQIIAQHEHDADESEKTDADYMNEKQEASLQASYNAACSKHDYWRYVFTGQAMQGMIGNQLSRNTIKEDVKFITEKSILIADELLKKLEESK